jgi:glycosyltransferase involved in cell wall biosynthesis
MVPTQGVLNMLQSRGFKSLKPWTHGVDLDLFEHRAVPLEIPELQGRDRPYALFVGRVSYEKNIDAFLDLQLQGTRIVCGVGPLEAQLKARYPDVVWMGVLPRQQLADVYAAADVFVFPSRNETFGLVMLEAMACGTPVAAFPVDGPLQVLGDGDGEATTVSASAAQRSASTRRGFWLAEDGRDVQVESGFCGGRRAPMRLIH